MGGAAARPVLKRAWLRSGHIDRGRLITEVWHMVQARASGLMFSPPSINLSDV